MPITDIRVLEKEETDGGRFADGAFRVPMEIRSKKDGWIHWDCFMCDETISSPKEADVRYTVDSLKNIFPMFTWSYDESRG
jgi:hypothetical protein